MNSIIITDLDGTFVKDSISVSPADILKMKKMQEEMLIGVATGRSLKEITYIEEQTGIKFDIKIGFNGAIVESFGKKIVDTALDETLKKTKSLRFWWNIILSLMLWMVKRELAHTLLKTYPKVGICHFTYRQMSKKP